MRSRLLAALVAALAASACGGEPVAPLEPCTGPVEMTVTANPLPHVRWTPRCGATELSMVAPQSSGFYAYWGIRSATSLIPPDVRYGEVPAGVEVRTPAAQFVSSGSVIVVFLRNAEGQIAQQAVTVP